MRRNAALAAAISGFGTLSKAGSGTLTLSGISAYTGATTVNGGHRQYRLIERGDRERRHAQRHRNRLQK